MREAKGDGGRTVELVKEVAGKRVRLRVNRGRNKTEELIGAVESTYPRVFTFRTEDGGLSCFCYADVLTGNVRFFRPPDAPSGQ